jgi:hypothetical protein
MESLFISHINMADEKFMRVLDDIEALQLEIDGKR